MWSLTQNFVLFKQFKQVVKKNEHEDWFLELGNLPHFTGFCLLVSAFYKWFFEVPWPLFPLFLRYTTEALTQHAHLWNGAVRKIWNVFVGRKTRNCNQNLKITGMLWIHSHQFKKKKNKKPYIHDIN